MNGIVIIIHRSVCITSGLYDIHADIKAATWHIGLVVVPDCLVETDMPYQQAVAGKIAVPAVFLTVLDYKELIIEIGRYDISLVAFGE